MDGTIAKRVALVELGAAFWTADGGLVDALAQQIGAAGVTIAEELRCLGCAREAFDAARAGYRMPGIGLWGATPAGLVLLHESVLAALAGAP